jgi:hypothetical protein
MRTLTALLLLAGIATAIPLRKGATLGYKVWRGWESDSTFATLTVLDSTATDSGTLWNVGIRDSLIGGKRIRMDTATLWVRGDTDTVWLAPSCLAAWDPSPRRISSASNIGYTSPLPYGELAGLCKGVNGPPDTVDRISYGLDGNTRTFALFEGEQGYFAPRNRWLQDTGLGRLRDDISNEDWKLSTVGGGSTVSNHHWDTTAALLTQMQVGESWVWEVEKKSAVNWSVEIAKDSIIRWTISATSPDSSGWLRRRVVSNGVSIDLRYNLSAGQTILSSSDPVAKQLALGMLRLWSDSASSDGKLIRSDFHLQIVAAFSSDVTTTRGFAAIGEGLDEWIQSETSTSESPTPINYDTTHILLLIHDSDTLRTASLSTPRLQALTTSLTSLSRLRQELSAHPTASVRIADLFGRTHAFPASEAMVALPSLHGVVLVEVREGTSELRGRLFLP